MCQPCGGKGNVDTEIRVLNFTFGAGCGACDTSDGATTDANDVKAEPQASESQVNSRCSCMCASRCLC